MFELLGPMMIGGSSILSAILGSSGADEANYINWLNYQEQVRANRAKELLAKEAQKLSTAGLETPTGSRTYFDRASNTWRTDTSSMDQALIDMEQQAQAQRLGPDEFRREVNVESDFRRMLEDSQMADSILAEMRDPIPVSQVSDAYDMERLNNERNFNSSYDTMTNAVMGGLRQTGVDPSQTMTNIIRDRMRSVPALAPSRREVEGQVEAKNIGTLNAQADRYNMFAGRSRNAGGPVASTGIGPSLTELMGASQGRPTAAALGSMQAYSNPAQHQGLVPKNDAALRVGAIGDAVGSFYDAWQEQNRWNDLMGVFKDRRRDTPKVTIGGGGGW